MAEESKKVVLPPFLLRRLEAFRVVKGEATTYIVRDKVQNKTYDFDAWQFFILEVLHGYETLPKLQSAFKERFDREITDEEVQRFLGQVADQKLLSEAAETHPLLLPFTRKTFDVSEGKAKPRSFEAAVMLAVAASPEMKTVTGQADAVGGASVSMGASGHATSSAGAGAAWCERERERQTQGRRHAGRGLQAAR